MIEVGDVLRSNDPRDGHRGDLVVTGISIGPRGKIVQAKGVRATNINIERIFDDGKPRKYGYRVERKA